MIKRIVIAHYDRTLLGFALVALLSSVGWFWPSGVERRRIRALPVAVRLSNSVYTPEAFPVSGVLEGAAWAKPSAQPVGSGWIYDLFTPPAVFYQRKLASFTVLPPFELNSVSLPRDPEAATGKLELYRLQLGGYFGETGAYSIVLMNPKKAGTLLAKVGDRLADYGVSIRDFSVARVALERKGLFSGFETSAQVELWDERVGAVVRLDSRHLKYFDSSESTVTTLAIDSSASLSRSATGLVTHKK